MLETIKHQWFAKVLFGLFIFFTLWWVYMTSFLPKDHMLFSIYGTFYGIIAAWGGIFGLLVAREWGWFKSIMGRAIIMFSLGLFAQEFGQIAYSYYIFVLQIEIPYPSIGDIGFFGTMPFYIYGAYLLASASGVRFNMLSFQNKFQVVVVPVILLAVAYFLFLQDYSFSDSTPMKTFLDFGYPFGQAIYISIALLTYTLTRKVLGGIMRPKVMFILIAFTVQFTADYAFLFFHDQYFPGSILDYLYVLAYFLMALGIFQLQVIATKIKNS